SSARDSSIARQISGPSAGAGIATRITGGVPTTVGSCSGSIPSFATSGDQVIAYSGSVSAPTLISILHMNVYSTDLGQCANTTAAALDPTCITDNANFSVMPLGLSAGVSSLWIGTEGVGASEQDNAKFVCGGPLSTDAEVRAAVTNQFKWVKNSVAPPNFTLPSGCGFFGLPPTAAGVSVSGRVMADGRGVGRVAVSLTDSDGISRTARTSPLGYFRFDDVESGQTYVLSATSKSYTFVPRALIVADEIADLELVAVP
ncbi:MAG TPA: carboxypeptidase regulatory-like domain-containing protein, partial [Pyrinomonadaceae bacterium]|nr:carboxypeptidase regulatory-like domain-containing protein [Pyrinomonadaceae bacterium]